MSEIRKAFTSRYDDGVILELDFSQLEIYALAYLSGDQVLMDDLTSGKDLHGISAEMLFGKHYTKEQRKIAKQLSFQLQYGAGAKSMAASNGITVELAKKFIENYYNRYKGVKEFHDKLLSEVESLRKNVGDRTSKKGIPAGRAEWVSKTGRIYTFVEQDAPDWMSNPTTSYKLPRYATFSPTQIKNYPVQGFATGDVVPLVVGKLFRELKASRYRIYVKIIQTVHDSVVFDCVNEEKAKQWAMIAKDIMEDAPRFMAELFPQCVDFAKVPLKVGVEMGKDWYDMHPLDMTA